MRATVLGISDLCSHNSRIVVGKFITVVTCGYLFCILLTKIFPSIFLIPVSSSYPLSVDKGLKYSNDSTASSSQKDGYPHILFSFFKLGDGLPGDRVLVWINLVTPVR